MTGMAGVVEVVSTAFTPVLSPFCSDQAFANKRAQGSPPYSSLRPVERVG